MLGWVCDIVVGHEIQALLLWVRSEEGDCGRALRPPLCVALAVGGRAGESLEEAGE